MNFRHLFHQGILALAANLVVLVLRILAVRWSWLQPLYELLLIPCFFVTPALVLWAFFKVFVEQQQDQRHLLGGFLLLLAGGVLVAAVLSPEQFATLIDFLLP